jgi:hypothetical protein
LFVEIEKLKVAESLASVLEIKANQLWEELKPLRDLLGANEEIKPLFFRLNLNY